MLFDSVGRKTDQLCTTLGELGLELCESTELGGADRSIIIGVREDDTPFVANKLMEVDLAVGCLSLEVGGSGSQTEAASMMLVNILVNI